MKKIYESQLRGFDESASRVIVYEIEEEEREELIYLDHRELCDYFGVFDESGYDVMPGAQYYKYNFDFADGYLVMIETVALNV